MIKARHHWFYVRFFHYYSRFMLRRHFRDINIKGNVTDKGLPVLLIGNHFSWWDGFFALYVNQEIFQRRFHVMMLEDQLKHRMFLNKAGAFGIRKKSHSVVEMIEYTRMLLQDPANIVAMYPQGEIRSMFHYPVRFEKGITKILSGMEDKVQVVFISVLVDYFSHRKPSLTFGVRAYDPGKNIDLKDMENAFNEHMKQMIDQQKE